MISTPKCTTPTNNETRWDLVFNCLNVQKAALEKSFSNLIQIVDMLVQLIFVTLCNENKSPLLITQKSNISRSFFHICYREYKLKGWN